MPLGQKETFGVNMWDLRNQTSTSGGKIWVPLDQKAPSGAKMRLLKVKFDLWTLSDLRRMWDLWNQKSNFWNEKATSDSENWNSWDEKVASGVALVLKFEIPKIKIWPFEMNSFSELCLQNLSSSRSKIIHLA